MSPRGERLVSPRIPGCRGGLGEGGIGLLSWVSPHRRPEWSFLWLQAPLRSLRYSIWRQHRCRISLGLALLLLLALVLAFIYAAPVSLGGTASPPISTLTSCKAPSELPFLPPCRVIWP